MATVSIRDWSRSGEPGTDLDRLFGPLYRRLMDDEPLDGLLEHLCSALLEDLPAALVAVAKKRGGGVIAMEAASPANELWAAFQALPERCDGTIAGRGPAAMALESGEAEWISAEEEGLRPWHEALARQQVAAVGAWPFRHAGEAWLLEVFSCSESFFRNGAVRRQVGRVVRELSRFLQHAGSREEQRLVSQALEHCGHAAFITNLNGEIEWTNLAFTSLYGYTRQEALGNTPRLLHSGRQGLRYYRDLWGTIRSGKVWTGETVDRAKDGTDYTVRQTVTPFGRDGRVTHYLSTHDNITDAAAERERLQRKSETDLDTGLLNPGSFDAAIDEAIAEGEPFTVALLSLRGFADATSKLNAELSEAVAAEFGSRLRAVLGPGSCAGVSGPGEFRLLLPMLRVSEATVRRVVEALEEPFPMLGQPLEVRPRIALARFPTDGNTRDALLRHADEQLADQPMTRANRKLKR